VSQFSDCHCQNFCALKAIGRERVKDGVYHFDVVVRIPFAGEVVRYNGLIKPVA